MRLRINGELSDVTATTVADVLRDRLGPAAGPGIAVALNGEVVPRTEWQTTPVGELDRIELLSAAQGG